MESRSEWTPEGGLVVSGEMLAVKVVKMHLTNPPVGVGEYTHMHFIGATPDGREIYTQTKDGYIVAIYVNPGRPTLPPSSP